MYSALTVPMMKLLTRYLIKFLKHEIHKTLGAAIFFAIVFNVSTAGSEEKRFASPSDLKFSSSISTAIGLQERSRLLSENLTNNPMEQEYATPQYPKAFTENSDGLIWEETESEVISGFDKIDKDDSYGIGTKRWKTLGPIRYALAHWFSGITNKKQGNSYRDELQGIEPYSNETTSKGVGVSIESMAIFQAYRFLQTRNWAPNWIKKETHDLGFSLTSGGGISVTYRIPL